MINVDPEFWRGKTVFLTGHTGFKGSWLAMWLSHLGARVHGFALTPPTEPSLYALAGIDELVTSVIADVRDGARLAREVTGCEPDVVLHLAAQSVVLRSYDDPIETYTTNVIGTANLLQAARRLSRRCSIVNVTTDKVYENRHWVWGYRETDMLGGLDPYSNSKACAELVSRAFAASFFGAPGGGRPALGLANARAGNVIGGGDWTPRQLVPEAIDAFSAGRPVELRHPEAVRPWQHVLDCLAGYLRLAEALYGDCANYAGDWNFGPADADMLPVSGIVERLASHFAVEVPWVRDGASHPHEEMELRLNSQKAQHELGWRPKLPLEGALAWTADWFSRQRAGESARGLCVEQIERYMALPAAPRG